MIKLLTGALFAILMGSALSAQTFETKTFESYAAMRGALDPHMLQAEAGDAIRTLLPTGLVPDDQLDEVQIALDEIYTVDFENSAVVATVRLDNGVIRQLLAYYTDATYLFALLEFEESETGTITVFSLYINTSVGELVNR